MSQIALQRKKRSRYEIVAEILEQCQNGARKTWVMYRANLSYDLTTNYLNNLVKAGLLENRDGLYYITDKGRQLLELLKEWREKRNEFMEINKKVNEMLPEMEEEPAQGQTQVQAEAPQS